ncbi:organomercurial lyase [Pseudactinotalea sp.]|uniref:organomercurial lyase n=1 Tax=Pseudactinotalea sp. TaxID=1926260 RepID=UPI003B3BBEF1
MPVSRKRRPGRRSRANGDVGASLEHELSAAYIDTACPDCGTALSYQPDPHLAPTDELAVRFPRPGAQWWDDVVVGTCTMIRTFCDRDHAQRWTDQHRPGVGYIAGATQVWQLAKPWYGDRLEATFEPHTRDLQPEPAGQLRPAQSLLGTSLMSI